MASCSKAHKVQWCYPLAVFPERTSRCLQNLKPAYHCRTQGSFTDRLGGVVFQSTAYAVLSGRLPANNCLSDCYGLVGPRNSSHHSHPHTLAPAPEPGGQGAVPGWYPQKLGHQMCERLPSGRYWCCGAWQREKATLWEKEKNMVPVGFSKTEEKSKNGACQSEHKGGWHLL